MKAGGGHEKGADFERWVAKQLNKWARQGDEEDLFWRSPGSGSRGRTMKKAGTHTGDITCTGDRGKPFIDAFWVECKSYRSVDWRGIIFDEKGEMLAYWRKLEFDAFKAQKFPLMIIKTNKKAPVVLTVQDASDLLGNRYIKISRLAPVPLFLCVYTWDKLMEQKYDTFLDELKVFKNWPRVLRHR